MREIKGEKAKARRGVFSVHYVSGEGGGWLGGFFHDDVAIPWGDGFFTGILCFGG